MKLSGMMLGLETPTASSKHADNNKKCDLEVSILADSFHNMNACNVNEIPILESPGGSEIGWKNLELKHQRYTFLSISANGAKNFWSWE